MSTHPLQIARIEREAESCASLWLSVPPDLRAVFRHRPGQFVSLTAEIGVDTVTRSYSISSLPDDPTGLRITVKKVPNGLMSSWLVEQAKVGDQIDVGTPRGIFFKPLDRPHRVLLLACGSGIAPILPIAATLLRDGKDHRIIVAHGSRACDHILLKSDLDNLAAEFKTCHVEHVISSPSSAWNGARGRIDPDFLRAREAVWRAGAEELPAVAYLCGPESFMDAAERHFISLGLEGSAIRRESFGPSLIIDAGDMPIVVGGAAESGAPGETCEEITASIGGEEIRVVPEPGDTILAALLKADAPVPYSCLEGTCSSCIAKLKIGTAHVAPAVRSALSRSDLDEGVVLACLAIPASKRVVIDFDEI